VFFQEEKSKKEIKKNKKNHKLTRGTQLTSSMIP